MFGDYTKKDDDNENLFWSDMGDTCCWLDGVKQISKHDFDVLKRYILKIEVPMKKETLVLT